MAGEVKGFFSVPRVAVTALMGASATSKQIGAYLVLAAFTDKSGLFSRAGKSAISNYLGVGAGAAGEIIAALRRIEVSEGKLVVDPKEWEGGQLGDKKTQWVVNDFGTSAGERVWIPKTLVASPGKHGYPLERLVKSRNDPGARALLLLYSEHDEEQVGGVRPCRTGWVPYTLSGITQVGGFNLAEAKSSGEYAFDSSFVSQVMGAVPSDDKAVGNVIDRLEAEGYLYRAVTVMDGPPDLGETEAVYCLDVKSSCDSSVGAEDDVVRTDVNVIAARHVLNCADAAGRFYTRYPVLVPVDYPMHVAEVFRLRHRIGEGSNEIIDKGLAQMKAGQAQVREWIAEAGDTADRKQPPAVNPEPVIYDSFSSDLGHENCDTAWSRTDSADLVPQRKRITSPRCVGGTMSPLRPSESQWEAEDITFD